MAGNFHRVIIFVIFVVDLAVTKIPPTKINAYVYVYIYSDVLLCKRKQTDDEHGMAWPKTLWQCRQLFSVLASNYSAS